MDPNTKEQEEIDVETKYLYETKVKIDTTDKALNLLTEYVDEIPEIAEIVKANRAIDGNTIADHCWDTHKNNVMNGIIGATSGLDYFEQMQTDNGKLRIEETQAKYGGYDIEQIQKLENNLRNTLSRSVAELLAAIEFYFEVDTSKSLGMGARYPRVVNAFRKYKKAKDRLELYGFE